MNSWNDRYRARTVSAGDALRAVESGHRVYSHMGCAHPTVLLDALCERARSLTNVELLHCITHGPSPYLAPEFDGRIRHNALFMGANVRAAVQEGRADFIPIFLHEVERLFTEDILPIDVALLMVTPPDARGYVSLGPAVDITMTAARRAKYIIAQVNPRLPRVYGETFLPADAISAFVEGDRPLPDFTQGEITPTHHAIARHVANLIPDEATLQIGVGGIPEAVLLALKDHKNLGIHTEMFSDNLLPLLASGVVNNSKKTIHPHKSVACFALGTSKFYEFLHDNPGFEFHASSYTNDPFVIARNHRMVAVNSALEIDLSGQVCADSIGSVPFSGVGGQVDFIRGVSRAPGGIPVIALPATAKNGTVSRIVPRLKPGAGVVTSRADVRWVATEHGAVNLFGKNVRQRAEALISIAAPQFRADLEREAATLFVKP
jgi:acyl-CoA hydrolase